MLAYLAHCLGWSALGLLAGAAVTDAGWLVRSKLQRRNDDHT